MPLLVDNNAARYLHAGKLIFKSSTSFAHHFLFRTGKFVGYQVPGAGVIMMMLEGIVPLSIRNWFEVVKTAVLDKTDNCETDFLCSLMDVD